MYTTLFARIRKTFIVTALLGIALYLCLPSAQAQEKGIPPEANPRPPIPIGQGPLQQINKYFSTQTITYSDGTSLVKEIINGPPTPPPGYELERAAVELPEPNQAMATNTLTVPAFNWVFGCSSVSGAMIAGYYDRNGYPNMYTGPTGGGVMPLNNSSWPTWSDGYTTYPNLPLAASHNGVDGRTTRGSIDDYWVKYGSTSQDPYVTGSWTQHAWGEAIGDYMKTSQSAYSNTDGSTSFWNYNSASQLTCSDMETFTSGGHTLSWNDGTYGRKLFYEARGYTVNTCYNQPTDNRYAGGFSFAQYKAEIDAGRPVMLNVEGHTMVGVGYNDTDNTVYLHDTWDYSNHTMTWGGSYSSMALLSVSIVNLQPAAVCTYSISPATRSVGGASGSGSVSVTASNSACAWTAKSNADWITVTSGSSGTGNGTVGYSYTALSPSACPVVSNGGFESGQTVWTEYSSGGWPLIMNSGFPGTVTPHSGSWAVWLGGASDETSYIQQQVTVSSGCPYLTFYHWIASADLCGYDYGYTRINGTTVDTVNLCSSNDTVGWVQKSINLSAYAGQTVTLQIRAATDGSENSNWFIDDVSFQSTGGANDTGTERTGTITIAGKTFTLTQTSSSECPDCPGDGVITNATYKNGTVCSCSNATSITLGSNVTVESGATVTFTAPRVNIQPGFHAESGSNVTIRQQ